VLNKAAGQRLHNHSPITKGDPDHIEKHLVYIEGFSANLS
jgi:hypothetical protein